MIVTKFTFQAERDCLDTSPLSTGFPIHNIMCLLLRVTMLVLPRQCQIVPWTPMPDVMILFVGIFSLQQRNHSIIDESIGVNAFHILGGRNFSLTNLYPSVMSNAVNCLSPIIRFANNHSYSEPLSFSESNIINLRPTKFKETQNKHIFK